MAILLTGATGFIGSEILRQLVARGTEVIAPVRSAQSAAAVVHELPDDGVSLFLVPVHASGLDVRGYPCVDGGRAAEVRLLDTVRPWVALAQRAPAAPEVAR